MFLDIIKHTVIEQRSLALSLLAIMRVLILTFGILSLISATKCQGKYNYGNYSMYI